MSEAASSEGVTGFVGEGEFPAEFDRPNYGAALFLIIWAFLYRVRGWRALLVALFVVPLVIENLVLLFIGAQDPLQLSQRILDPVMLVGYLIAQAVFGLRANRIIWDQESARFEAAGGDPPHPIPLWRYRKSTRFWTMLGFALVAVDLVLEAVLLVVRHGSLMDVLTSLPFAVVPLFVIFLVDWWRRGRVAAS
jgi:hypothetical protein